RLTTEQRQEILELDSSKAKLERLLGHMSHELEVLELGRKIQTQAEEQMGKAQREYFLREQLKAIQRELGELDSEHAELSELRERIEKAGLPTEAKREADREIGRLERIPSPSPASWDASSPAPPSAACTTRRRYAATGAPTSGPCPGASSRPSAAPSRTTRSSCSTRSTRSARTGAATRRRRCSRSWTRSRTRTSATTTSTCPSTCRRSCSSPPPTPWRPSRRRCGPAWRGCTSPATPKRRRSRSTVAFWSPC